jgi:hypothetical protein
MRDFFNAGARPAFESFKVTSFVFLLGRCHRELSIRISRVCSLSSLTDDPVSRSINPINDRNSILRTYFKIPICVSSPGESEAPVELKAAKSHSILLSRSLALPNNEVQLDFENRF